MLFMKKYINSIFFNVSINNCILSKLYEIFLLNLGLSIYMILVFILIFFLFFSLILNDLFYQQLNVLNILFIII